MKTEYYRDDTLDMETFIGSFLRSQRTQIARMHHSESLIYFLKNGSGKLNSENLLETYKYVLRKFFGTMYLVRTYGNSKPEDVTKHR